MRLKYTKLDGTTVEKQLETEPITIGRSPDSDLIVLDERASRVHCGIRFWDGEYVLRDLKSMNGTYVNGQRVDTHTLAPGDSIRVGSTIIAVESEESAAPGATTAIREIKDEMESGKGYDTLLKEIVADSEKPKAEEPPPPPAPVAEADLAPAIPVALPPADADAAEAGLMMGPSDGDSRGPRLPPMGENGKKRIKIVVKKKFGT
jgi:predicted component of type VI protein secretion system